VLQELRRKHVDASFPATSSDLRLPVRRLSLRRTSPEQAMRVDEIVELIATGKLAQAWSDLNAIDRVR
jgi:hypothetical protein